VADKVDAKRYDDNSIITRRFTMTTTAIPVMNWSVDVIFLKTGKISTKVGELA